MWFTLLLLAGLATHGSSAPLPAPTCPSTMTEGGLTSRFSANVAHRLHSLTLEDLRYYFAPDATEHNNIPTVNMDLMSDERVLPNAPLNGYDTSFTSVALRHLDQALRTMDDANYGIKNTNPLEKVAHVLHMAELWSRASIHYRALSLLPPSRDVCACVQDTTNNGILSELQLLALKIRYPGITSGNYKKPLGAAYSFGYNFNSGGKPDDSDAPAYDFDYDFLESGGKADDPAYDFDYDFLESGGKPDAPAYDFERSSNDDPTYDFERNSIDDPAYDFERNSNDDPTYDFERNSIDDPAYDFERNSNDAPAYDFDYDFLESGGKPDAPAYDFDYDFLESGGKPDDPTYDFERNSIDDPAYDFERNSIDAPAYDFERNSNDDPTYDFERSSNDAPAYDFERSSNDAPAYDFDYDFLESGGKPDAPAYDFDYDFLESGGKRDDPAYDFERSPLETGSRAHYAQALKGFDFEGDESELVARVAEHLVDGEKGSASHLVDEENWARWREGFKNMPEHANYEFAVFMYCALNQ